MFREAAPTPAGEIESFDDPALGIDDPGVAELVGQILTRLLFDACNRDGAHCVRVGGLLKLYATTELRAGGTAHPAPVPDLPEKVIVPHGITVRNRLGLTYEGDRDLWDQLEAEAGPVFACAPPSRLAHNVPTVLWPVVAAAISDGPTVYARRAARLLLTERDRKVPPTRRRPQGGFVSNGQLNSVRDQAIRLMNYIGEHAWQDPHPLADHLKPWRVELPKIKKVSSKAGATRNATDNSPPPWHEVRELMARLSKETQDCLRVNSLGEEIEAIRNGPINPVKRLFQRTRERAILLVLTNTGPRMAELERLNRSHYDPSHRHAEGTTPALFIQHTKNTEPPAWHPITPEAGLVIESYLAVIERITGQALGPDEPLFITKLTRRDRQRKQSIERKFGGGVDAKALMPIDPEDPYVGYRPHTMRKVLKQWCSSQAAAEWCEEHGISPDRREIIGEAAIAHNIDSVANLYRDDTSVEGKERLRYWAACIAWEMLFTPRGARMVPDVDAYRSALREIRGAEHELQRVEAEVEKLCLEAERNGHDINPAAILGRMQKTTRLARSLVDARMLVVEIESGRKDRMKPIPDDANDDDVPTVDLAAIREDEENGLPAQRLRRLRPIRNWITPEELADLLSVGRSTVRGWLTKGLPRGKEIWDPSAPPIIEFNARRRAILAEGINPEALKTTEQRLALAELLAQDPPEGWTHLASIASVSTT